MLFGMTRQEATIYIELCRNEQLTGYEAAKLTGISRSNVYNALASLSEKGAAYIMDGSTSKYVSVPIAEFCSNKIRRLDEVKQELIERLSHPRESEEGYITIEGYRHILDKLHNMIASAEKRLYLSAPVDLVNTLNDDIHSALARDIKVVLITDCDPEKAIAAISPSKHLPKKTEATIHLSKRLPGQVRLIIDSEYVLTGEITGKNTDTCLYSGQKNFVAVLKDALRNEIKLIALEDNIPQGKGEV